MANDDRVATVSFVENNTWTNKHENVSQAFERLYYIQTPEPRDGSKIVEDMAATASAMQGILKDAIDAGKRLRCIGGGWSLSDAAVTDGWLLSTEAMNLYWTMVQSQIDPGYQKDISGLYFTQCGVSVQELNETVEGDGKSLTTSGASNGQTIAGAIATGTHGSAFQYGSMPDFVVGFHLITDPEKVIWLERASYPVVSDQFVQELGAELKRDDDLFNAVLVSFGSMGIIAGIMIETEPKYLFEAQRFLVPLGAGLRNAMDTLIFDNIALPHPGETPWHFEVTFNPHDTASGYVRTLYKRPYTDVYTKPDLPGGEIGPGESLLSIIGTINGLLTPTNVALVMKALIQSNLAPYGPAFGTNGEIFSLTTLRGKAMSMELGIALEDSSRVLDLLLGLSPEIDVYAGVISFRWVKQTKATLGWIKFPVATTIEFNAAYSNDTLAFYNRIWNELAANGISYTLHWGQMYNFTPGLVRSMYGASVDNWLACRDALISVPVKQVFSSNFMSSTGLG